MTFRENAERMAAELKVIRMKRALRAAKMLGKHHTARY